MLWHNNSPTNTCQEKPERRLGLSRPPVGGSADCLPSQLLPEQTSAVVAALTIWLVTQGCAGLYGLY